MALLVEPQLALLAGAGVVGGLGMLVRGFGGYRRASEITDTAPSRISSIAVGEVLVSGVVEPAELTLVSPLQSVDCVFYRSRVDQSDGKGMTTAFREERAVGFRIRDDSGSLRVFPRGARFDVPEDFDENGSVLVGDPPGLLIRSGSSFAPPADRDAQIAALLTVHPPSGSLPSGGDNDGPEGLIIPRLGGANPFAGLRAQHYREARIEAGDVVTVLGLALPFDQLDDPAGADSATSDDPQSTDPEIAADLAEARAAGTLTLDPKDAWGNAAIPGFGIGHPVRAPELDAAATRSPIAAPADADRYGRTFEIAPDALVLAASSSVPLVIASGPPAAAARREERLFLIGLLGAILAIGSAMAMAIVLGGWLGRS
jgi:hypothetical protein